MASVREAVKRLEQLGLVEVRHGDAMRVTDWRASGGLDVIAHVLFAGGDPERSALEDLMEARRLMLVGAARLAAERRDEDQAGRLRELADRIAAAPDTRAAQAIDFAFFSELVEAARNVVLVLVMNSIRLIYFERAEFFTALVEDRERLAPIYGRAARAVARHQPGAAARAVAELAESQHELLMEGLS